MDVAIVGVGLHPFGRFPGVTAHRDGCGRDPRRARRRRASSGRTSSSRSPAATRSTTPTPSSRCMGLTGIPFTDVYNGCATAASALTLAANTIRLGDHHLGIAVGMDKHPPGAFGADPRLYACPEWYGERRPVRHHEVLRHEDQQVHARPRHLAADAGAGRGEELPQRIARTRTRSGASRSPRRRSSARRTLNYPLTQYMFCSPDEGAAAVILCPAEDAHKYTEHADLPAGHHRAHPAPRRVRGAPARGSRWSRRSGPTVDASRAAYEMAGIGPEDVDVIQLQDTDAGAEVIHLAENGFCADGDQEQLYRRRRHRDRRAAAGQHRRRPHRQRRAGRRVGAAPDPRDRAAAPGPGRRPPGAGQPEGRLHPALRRARHRGRLHPHPSSADQRRGPP